MKIAITADPEIPVPPVLYGGIERIIFMLIEQLVSQGHEVILFAHKDSKVPCKLIAYPGPTQSKIDVLRNTFCIFQGVAGKNFDVVHSFGRLAYLTPILPMSLKKIMSYQREPTVSQITLALKLAKKNSIVFTGCSDYIAAKIRPFAKSYAIHNFVNICQYTFVESVDKNAPLVFLGRVEHIKGAHIAIEVAQRTGRKLVIAGNIPNEPMHQEYFNTKIKPFVDNEQIQYIGPVNDQQKNSLLGRSAAFLMPIQWNEPFGIVMAEAMACGTPVIGFGRGAIPEVITDQVDGFMVNTIDEMIEAVYNIHAINRKKVRESAEQRFSAEVIALQYEQIYI